MTGRSGFVLLASLAVAACSKGPPPPSVADFVENERLLEATMVRCARDRVELKYTPECLNAREAVNRLAAAEEAERRKELEAQSARKREALRRAQQAAAAARARAAEAERRRREAELLGEYEPVPDEPGDDEQEGGAATMPPQDPGQPGADAPPADTDVTESSPPPATAPADESEQPGDLEAVREELERRNNAAAAEPPPDEAQ
ncbi:MAG: EexN family lipoprotein [Woeseiaceae bacterium]|nr:EexN family lipoprotein [Woeseiaceae bacterium]